MARVGAVVVTGASTGIGAATVQRLLARGHMVFAGIRREADGARLRDAAGDAAGRLTALRLDVTEDEGVAAAAEAVQRAMRGARLLGLVNNAGIALGGPLALQPMAEIEAQIAVNLLGVVRVTRAFLPLLGMDRRLSGPPGRVVNISSVAGGLAAPFVGAYAASKHGLEGLTHAWRREALMFGIDMVLVAPGAVRTPIWDKGEAQDFSRYDGTPYATPLGRMRQYMLSQTQTAYAPLRIARVIEHALIARRPRARYAVVPGRVLNWSLPRLLPARTLDCMIAGRIGLQPIG